MKILPLLLQELHKIKHRLFTKYKFLSLKHINTELYKSCREQIITIFNRFYFRDPTDEELDHHYHIFVNHFISSRDMLESVRSGKIYLYTGIRPFSLELDITNYCNLRCKMCYFSSDTISKRKREDMPVEEYQSIAEQIFPHVNRMNFSIGTEPLLHKKFEELVNITRPYAIPKLCMNTNGTLMRKKISELLVSAQFFSIGVSIDAATSETYEEIRQGGKFEKVISNIRTLVDIKKQKNSCQPYVIMNFVMMKTNISELPAFIELAHELGVDGVGASHMVPFSIIDTENESLVHDKNLCNNILDKSRNLAAKLNINFVAPENFSSGEPASPSQSFDEITNRFDLNIEEKTEKKVYCPLPFYFIGIDSGGNILPCGYWYSEKPMGNIKQQSFLDIWQNRAYGKLRSELINITPRDTCKTCPSTGIGKVDNEYSFKSK